MDVILSTEGVDLQECDLLVTGFFEDERPLKGSSGWIDWRLNGMLSHFLVQKRLTGEWMETTLIPSQGRVLPRMILLIGLGKVKEYSYLRARELSPHLLRVLRNLNFANICLSLPEDEDHNVECGKLVEVLLEGIADSMDLAGTPLEEWVKNVRLFFTEGEERFEEIFLGAQTAKSILGERLQIRICAPAEKDFEKSS